MIKVFLFFSTSSLSKPWNFKSIVLAGILLYQPSKFILPFPLPILIPFGFLEIGQFKLTLTINFILFFFFLNNFLIFFIISLKFFQFIKPALILFITIWLLPFFFLKLITFSVPRLFLLNFNFFGNFFSSFFKFDL